MVTRINLQVFSDKNVAVSCADCMMCSGTNSKVKKNITIIIH